MYTFSYENVLVWTLLKNRMICLLTQEDEVQQKKKSERARRFLEEKKRRDEELKTKLQKVCSTHFKHTLLKAFNYFIGNYTSLLEISLGALNIFAALKR